MATYTQFDKTPDVGDVVDDLQKVFASAWSGGENNLASAGFFTSSTQYVTDSPTASGAFFQEIYNKNPQSDDSAEVQFSIAYGSKTGKGGMDFNDDVGAENISSTKAIYSQYRNLVEDIFSAPTSSLKSIPPLPVLLPYAIENWTSALSSLCGFLL
jgi:hypothetical protein